MKTLSTFLAISVLLCFLSFSDVATSLHNYFAGQKEATESVTSTYSVTAASNVTNIVAAAEAFKASLSAAQVDTLQYTFDSTKAQSWSNLPCGNTCRYGIALGSLDSAQLELAKALLKLAAGTAKNEGYDEFFQIVTADSILAQVSGGGVPGGGMGGGPGGGDTTGFPGGGDTTGFPGGGGGTGGGTTTSGSGTTSGYGKGIYFISFLNEPSTTGAWMLQFGGHHYAANIAFNNGLVVGATPHFLGIEPKFYYLHNSTTGDSTLVAPLYEEHATMVNMLQSLTAAERENALITTQTFTDVLLGPGEDGNFPTKKVGQLVGALSDSQKALVQAAMEPWIEDVDDETADSFRTIYANELDSTYISYTGHTALDSNTNYVRIDGPSVWIEFILQNGIVYSDSIHYHSVWRDHKRDYGNYITATALPLNLTSFTGSVQGATRLLSWTTANEVNTKYFSVERSLNPSQGFTSLEQITAKNGVSNSYTFTDREPVSEGIYYYRLMLVDKDGTTKYSQVVQLKKSAVKSITLYPNPAINKVTISAVNGLSNATIKVINSTGKVVLVKANVTGKQVDMNVSGLSAGLYIVQVQNGSSTTTYKFAKQISY